MSRRTSKILEFATMRASGSVSLLAYIFLLLFCFVPTLRAQNTPVDLLQGKDTSSAKGLDKEVEIGTINPFKGLSDKFKPGSVLHFAVHKWALPDKPVLLDISNTNRRLTVFTACYAYTSDAKLIDSFTLWIGPNQTASIPIRITINSKDSSISIIVRAINRNGDLADFDWLKGEVRTANRVEKYFTYEIKTTTYADTNRPSQPWPLPSRPMDWNGILAAIGCVVAETFCVLPTQPRVAFDIEPRTCIQSSISHSPEIKRHPVRWCFARSQLQDTDEASLS